MTTCLGKSCICGLFYVPFVNVYGFAGACSSLLFGFEGGMWNLIVLFPDHCLSINFECQSSNGYVEWRFLTSSTTLI